MMIDWINERIVEILKNNWKTCRISQFHVYWWAIETMKSVVLFSNVGLNKVFFFFFWNSISFQQINLYFIVDITIWLKLFSNILDCHSFIDRQFRFKKKNDMSNELNDNTTIYSYRKSMMNLFSYSKQTNSQFIFVFFLNSS